MKTVTLFAFILSLVASTLTGYLMYRFDQNTMSINQMNSDYEEHLRALRESTFELNTALQISSERLTLLTDNMDNQISKIETQQKIIVPNVNKQEETLKNLQRSFQSLDTKWEQKFSELAGPTKVINQETLQNNNFLNQIRYLVLLANAFWSGQGDANKALQSLSIAEHSARNLPSAQYQLIIDGIAQDIEIINKLPENNFSKQALNQLSEEIYTHIDEMIKANYASTTVNPTTQASYSDEILGILKNAFVISRAPVITEISWKNNELTILKLLIQSYIARAKLAFETENESEWLTALQDMQTVLDNEALFGIVLTRDFKKQIIILTNRQIRTIRQPLEHSKIAVDQAFQIQKITQ